MSLSFKDYPGVEEKFNTEMFLCAGKPKVRSSNGDSGGPLMVEDDDKNLYQIGTVSFGALFYDSGTLFNFPIF